LLVFALRAFVFFTLITSPQALYACFK
jgi:hypothetical protein